MLAARLRREYVVPALCVERQAAHDPHDRRRRGEGDGDDDVEAARSEIVQDQDEQDHHRKRQEYVADQRDRLIPPAAEIAGEQAEERADRIGDQRRGNAPHQHALTAPQVARQHVAALEIGAEQEEVILLEGADRREGRDRFVRIDQRQVGRGHGDEQPEEDQRRADNRDRRFSPGRHGNIVERERRRDRRQQHDILERAPRLDPNIT